MYKPIQISFLLLAILSCATQKKNVLIDTHRSEPACGGNFEDRFFESEKPFLHLSTVEIYSLIKDSDTIQIKELICSDSIKFTQAFNHISVPEFCIEANYQGDTYYSVKIDSTGYFNDFKTVRKVDDCFDSFDEAVELKLKSLKVLSNEFFKTELIFYHKFRME